MKEWIAYVDAFSGASGDMLLGAMLHAGLDLDELKGALSGLGVSGYELSVERQVRHGITGIKFIVIDPGGERPARNLSSIRKIVEGSGLPDAVTERSLAVFEAIARAEAEIHGTTVDEVHFHEIGAVDSLVDVVGFCWGLEALGVGALYASPLPLGSGTIRTEHGLLPVPAPATLALLAARRVPTVPSEARVELVTPTGAALLAELARFERPAIAVERVGYGFGTRELPWANVLRLWVGRAVDTAWQPAGHAGAGTAGVGHGHHHDHHHGHAHGHDAED